MAGPPSGGPGAWRLALRRRGTEQTACARQVAADLRNERFGRREPALTARARDEIKLDVLPRQPAGELQQMLFAHDRAAAERGTTSEIHRTPVPPSARMHPYRIDTLGRQALLRGQRDIRRRNAEPAAPSGSADHAPPEPRWTSEQTRGFRQRARGERTADARAGNRPAAITNRFDGDDPHPAQAAKAAEHAHISEPVKPEQKRFSDDQHARAQPFDERARDERLSVRARERSGKRDDPDVIDAQGAQLRQPR